MDNFDNKVAEKKETINKVAFTKVVWAGRRRYFFDVLSTKAGEKYLSITESRRKQGRDGENQFENQKLFLFKEDFEKFSDALKETLDFIHLNREGEPNEASSTSTLKSEGKTNTYGDDELDKFKVVDLEFENL